MLVIVTKAIIFGILVYGAKQYYFEEPQSNTQNVEKMAPVTTRKSYERLITLRRTTKTTTTEKPMVFMSKKQCGLRKLCVPYQFCNETAVTESVDGFYIDYNDTDTKCGYLNKCCDESKVIKLKPNEKPREPLIYKSCSFAADYKLKHKHENENFTQSEIVSLPWIVNVVQRDRYALKPNDTYVCAGALITANLVLTGASCFMTAPEMFGDLFVRAGEFGTNMRSVETQERRVSRRIKHKDKYLIVFSAIVLLLALERPFVLKDYLQPVCLPPKATTLNYGNCLIAGFARGGYERLRMGNVTDYNLEKRQRFTLKLLPAEERCPEHVLSVYTHDKNRKLKSRFICIDKEIDDRNCHADEGSAIVCAKRGSLDFYLVGLARQNVRCNGFASLGIETNVAFYREWIEKTSAEYL